MFSNVNQHKDIELWLAFDGNVFCHSSMMLRKEILDKNHIEFDSHYVPTEDYAFWLSLIGLTKFAVLEEYLGEYRFYSENISNEQAALQHQKGDEAQIKFLTKYLNIEQLDLTIFGKFMSEQNLNLAELKHIDFILPQIIQVLTGKGYSDKDICNFFKKHLRKLFLHTHTLYGHYLLLRSPLNKYFNIPLEWRLFCFITRGIF